MIQPPKKWLFPVILFLGFTLQSWGQEIKTYEGPLQVGPYSGKAVYQYAIIDLDTVYDGDFQLQNSNLETLMENEDSSFRFKGFFDKGVANGPWKFQFGEFQTNSQTQVVDTEYRVLVSGVQEIGEGNLDEGAPDGKWTYTINKIKDSEIEKILFKSNISFEKGVPQQNFQIENDSSVLVGRLLRDGLAHDEWSFYGTENVEDIEDWFFDDGLMRNLQITTQSRTEEVSVFDANLPNYQITTLNEGYITLLQSAIDLQNGESHIARLLAQNLGYYQKMQGVLNHLENSQFKLNMQVRVPFFPLDSIQKNTLEQIATDYESAVKLSQTILENSHLNIVKRTDPEALFYYNAAAKIDSEFLKPMGTLVKHKKLDVVQYQQIPELLDRLWPNGKPGTKLLVVANEKGEKREFSLPSSDEFQYESNDLLSVSAMATYARMSLEFIKGSLASRLTNEEQLQMLNGLEEELIELNNALEKQLDSVSGLPSDHTEALSQIKNVADSSLTTYADIKNPQEKLEYGEGVKTCLLQLRSLVTTIKELPERSEMIKKEYTDAVWNPFMANVMEEEVKKRIVSAYENVLRPYFINSVREELRCDNAGMLNGQITNTQQIIMELRYEDTRKLERKLRREKRPEEVIKLLQEQSNHKNQ